MQISLKADEKRKGKGREGSCSLGSPWEMKLTSLKAQSRQSIPLSVSSLLEDQLKSQGHGKYLHAQKYKGITRVSIAQSSASFSGLQNRSSSTGWLLKKGRSQFGHDGKVTIYRVWKSLMMEYQMYFTDLLLNPILSSCIQQGVVYYEVSKVKGGLKKGDVEAQNKKGKNPMYYHCQISPLPQPLSVSIPSPPPSFAPSLPTKLPYLLQCVLLE